MGSSCNEGGCECGVERKFYTREEKLEWMKEYKEQLELELKAVKEKLEWLQKK